MPKPKWKEIVSADDNVVSGDLLEWSGLDELWQLADEAKSGRAVDY